MGLLYLFTPESKIIEMCPHKSLCALFMICFLEVWVVVEMWILVAGHLVLLLVNF